MTPSSEMNSAATTFLMLLVSSTLPAISFPELSTDLIIRGVGDTYDAQEA